MPTITTTTTTTTATTAGTTTTTRTTTTAAAAAALAPQPSAEEGEPPAAASSKNERSAEDKRFLLANYPKCIEDVTGKWMSVLMRAEVTAIAVKVKLEAGVTGDAAIFSLEYAAGSTGPSSVVLKYAKALEANRELAQEARMYEKETYFYKNLHNTVKSVLPIPEVYDVFEDPENPTEFFCIAMEDLSVDFETCDQIKGMKWQDCNIMAADVAKLHATFWESEQLKEDIICGGQPGVCNVWFETWTRGYADDPTMVDKVNKILLGPNKNLPRNGGSLELFPSDDHKLMLRLWKAHPTALCEEFHRILDARPFTLTHGDLRADNLFSKREGRGFKFIDWQTYAAAAPGCDMTQMLAASIAPVADMDHITEILTTYLETLHASAPASRAYTMQMLKDDFSMTTTMLYIGFAVPFAGILEGLPDDHPLWVLFDEAFPRYVRCTELLDCAGMTIRVAKRLGLEPDPLLPYYVDPDATGGKKPSKIRSTADSSVKIMRKLSEDSELNAVEGTVHVRGIGVDGWDGTDTGVGTYENEAALGKIFGAYGKMVSAAVRHRVQAGSNASWALVSMDSEAAVDRIVAAAASAEGILAGSSKLKVERFNEEIASASTGGMLQVLGGHTESLMAAAMASGMLKKKK